MKTRILVFLAIFFGAIMCSVIIAFCGGVQFGTADFGGIITAGMVVGGVAGVNTAVLGDYK